MSEASQSKKNKVQDKSVEPSADEPSKGHSSEAQGPASAPKGAADGPVPVKLAAKADEAAELMKQAVAAQQQAEAKLVLALSAAGQVAFMASILADRVEP